MRNLLLFCLAWSSPAASFLWVSPKPMQRASPSSTKTTKNAKRNNVDNAIHNSQRPDITHFPKLVVLDLDNTVWTPELYQLKRRSPFSGRSNNNNRVPAAHHDVQLFPGAADLLDTIRQGDYFPSDTQFAVASRTQSVDWAHSLLTEFGWREVMDHVEIFPGHKRQHFRNLQRSSGLDFAQMLFLDDARDGKYGNCVPIAQELNVLSVHCPNGMETSHIWHHALSVYDQRQQQSQSNRKLFLPPAVVEWDGTVTELTNGATTTSSSSSSRQTGRIKTINHDKGFGFVQSKNGDGDVFFHFSKLPLGVQVAKGDTLSYVRVQDARTGKWRADDIQVEQDANGSDSGSVASSLSPKDTVSLHAFSMNMPFAALLANGYKTLESRNGTMFVPYEAGTHMLLHVGRRTYPDGNKHMEILRDAGMDDNEITRLKSLPDGFGKGALVAIVELGETYDTTVAERSTPDMQQQISAYGTDSGRRLTEIRRVAYLKRPVPTPAQGGVWKVQLDRNLLPDDWTLPTAAAARPQAYRVDDNTKDGRQPQSGRKVKKVYSISG